MFRIGLGEQPETLAVVAADAVLIEGLPVLECAVAFIVFPIIVGKFFVKLFHVRVAMSFRKNARSGDTGINAISFYHAFVAKVPIGIEAVAIDQ